MAEQTNMQVARPFLKWAGGKRQLIPILEKNLPEELLAGQIENYYEPFLGSGALFFYLSTKYSFKNIFLSDTNIDLILSYNVIKNNVDDLIKELEFIQNQYFALEKEERKKYFYSVRLDYNIESNNINLSKYNKSWIKRTSKLIFLNKTCFNGLFRLNLKGEFNTPFGDYKNPKIYDPENLKNVSTTLQNVKIEQKDFCEISKGFLPRSFVYFDPPYRPISNSSNFTSYSKNSFTDADQIELSKIYTVLNNNGGKLMLSNSDPKNTNKNDTFFDDLYSDYTIKRIPAKRFINSKADKRGNINELLIVNY